MDEGEKFNTISHLIGAAFAIAAASILITLSAIKGDTYKIVGFSIYGAMLVLLYTISTIYHSTQGEKKEFFRRLDYISIYLMIAGTYTPFTLVTLKGAWGWSILGTIWTLAFIGIVQELLFGKKTRRYSVILYLLMGWVIVVATKPMIENLPIGAIIWLFLGGIAYTGGVVAFMFDEKIKHGHGIWHIFVLLGTICHFASLIGYVV